MKRINLLIVIAFLSVSLQLIGQEITKYRDYDFAFGTRQIRTLFAEGETGVLLECGIYQPDIADLDKSPFRSKWFCLDPDEVYDFITFLDNLKSAYTLLLKNASDAQFVDAVKLPSIGTCVVANFEKETGFVITKRGYPLSPWFDVKSKSIKFSYSFYHDKNGEFESNGEYFTSVEFIFNSPEQISDLRNKLNNLLQQY